MPHKTDHLQLHGGKWRVCVAVPRELRPIIGKAYLLQALGTADLDEANRLKGAYLSRFRTEIAAARRPDDPILALARMHRHRIEAAQGDAEADFRATLASDEAAQKVEQEHGLDVGMTFGRIALGMDTPLDLYLDDWLASEKCHPKYAQHRRKAIAMLIEWCRQQNIKPFLETISHRIALRFRDKCLRVKLKEPRTVNSHLTVYRSYWRYLMPRTDLAANPWLETTDKGRWRDKANDDGARLFTDDEMIALLTGSAPSGAIAAHDPLLDLMRVAALTGARVDALCGLRVSDCANGCFRISKAKEEKKGRTVPIHSDLKSIVERRTAGKRSDEFLFHELPDATPARGRSASAVQAFTRYRRKLGIDERPGGKRQSNVTFHSFRRWFITKAEQAGQTESTIQAVVGHKRPGVTLGIYGKEGPSLVQLRACVESVKLPRLPATAMSPAKPHRALPPRRRKRAPKRHRKARAGTA